MGAVQTINITGDMAGSGSQTITTTINGLKGKPLPDLATGILKYTGSAWAFETTPYLTGNQTITMSGDLSGTGATSISATVNGLKGVALPTLSSGLLKYNGAAWVFDTNSYLIGNQTITISGDLSGTGATSISSTVNGLKGASLPSLSAGLLKYTGSVWSFDNSSYLTANQSITLSGDISGSGSTGISATVGGLKGSSLPELANGSLQYNGSAWEMSKIALMNDEISVTGATTLSLNRMHVCSGTSADYTVTLPTASGNAGRIVGVRMSNSLTKLVTVDGYSTEQIDGQATRIMWAGESAILLSDGSNWTKIAGRSRPMYTYLYPGSNQTFNAAVDTLLNFTTEGPNSRPAAFVTAAQAKVNILRPGLYAVKLMFLGNGTNSSVHTLTATSRINGNQQFVSALLVSNGSGLTYTSGICQGSATMAAGDYIQPYGMYSHGSYTTSVYYVSINYSGFSVDEIISW